MDYEREIDKLLDAIIDISHGGVNLEVILKQILKSLARLKVDVDELKNCGCEDDEE